MTSNQHFFDHILERVHERLGGENTELTSVPVQHGVRITCFRSSGKAEGILYHSRKKRRFSFVPVPNGDSELADELTEAIAQTTGAAPKTPSNPDKSGLSGSLAKGFKCWIGTDEAGKGDLFGPLVVGGFIADVRTAEQLKLIGIRDSKDLTPSAISRLAKQLREAFPDRFEIVETGPKRYNEMYGGFKSKGGINGMLGWAHGRVIANLAAKKFPVDGVVVDKFAGEHRLRPYLGEARKLPLVLTTRGERDFAVAAAAILARDRFDRALDRMEKTLGFRPHAGSGAPAVNDLRRLHKTPQLRLDDHVKMHFSPVGKLKL